MKILCGIVIYRPNKKDLLGAIESVINQVDEILIINNLCDDIILEELREVSTKIKIISYSDNKGIAKALNDIIKYSTINHYDYTLTMDQDSICDDDYINQMIENDEENVALFTPQIIDLNEKQTINKKKLSNHYVNLCITSGCLMKNKYINQIGKFNNNLFIDFVDFDYCLKTLKCGFLIKNVINAKLYHHLGNAQEIKFISKLFKRPVYTYNHNATRTFYYNRNAIYLLKYHKNLPNKFKFVLGIIKWDIFKLFFESNKQKNFIAIIKGLIKGIQMEAE